MPCPIIRVRITCRCVGNQGTGLFARVSGRGGLGFPGHGAWAWHHALRLNRLLLSPYIYIMNKKFCDTTRHCLKTPSNELRLRRNFTCELTTMKHDGPYQKIQISGRSGSGCPGGARGRNLSKHRQTTSDWDEILRASSQP